MLRQFAFINNTLPFRHHYRFIALLMFIIFPVFVFLPSLSLLSLPFDFFLLCLSHFSFHFSLTSFSFYSVITVPCFNLPLYYFCSSFFYISLSQSQISFFPHIWIIDIDHCSSLTFLILFFLSMITILSFSFFIFLLSAFLTVLLSTSAIWNSICNAITLIIIIQFLDIHISSESFNSRPHLIFVETNVILFRISWQFGFKFVFSWFQMTTWKFFFLTFHWNFSPSKILIKIWGEDQFKLMLEDISYDILKTFRFFICKQFIIFNFLSNKKMAE